MRKRAENILGRLQFARITIVVSLFQGVEVALAIPNEPGLPDDHAGDLEPQTMAIRPVLFNNRLHVRLHVSRHCVITDQSTGKDVHPVESKQSRAAPGEEP